MPCFEGLFPEDQDDVVQDLLFDVASWHSLAKMQAHTEQLDDADQTTTDFPGTLNSQIAAHAHMGNSIRCLEQMSDKMETRELPSEVNRRKRAALLRRKAKGHTSDSGPSGPRIKKLSMATAKLHATGHYPDNTRDFGTYENLSTQVVSLSFIHSSLFPARYSFSIVIGRTRTPKSQVTLRSHQ